MAKKSSDSESLDLSYYADEMLKQMKLDLYKAKCIQARYDKECKRQERLAKKHSETRSDD